MSIEGPGPGSPPNFSPPSKPGKKSSKNSGFLNWGITTSQKIKNKLLRGQKQPQKTIESFEILTSEDVDLATLDALNIQIEKLPFHGKLDPEDPKFKDTYTSLEEVLTQPPAPSKSNPAVAAQLDIDQARNGSFKLKVQFPNQTLETSTEPVSLLSETVKKLKSKDCEALMLQLSIYCTQVGFSMMTEFFQTACKEALNEAGICNLAADNKRRCILLCKNENTIEAQLVIHSDALRIFPTMDKPITRPNHVTVMAVVKIPVNEPENASLEKVTLRISQPFER